MSACCLDGCCALCCLDGHWTEEEMRQAQDEEERGWAEVRALNEASARREKQRMQLIKCPIEPCAKGEMWDSAFEIKEHNAQFHPDVVADEDFATQELISEIGEQAYTFAAERWADNYRPGSFEAVFADIYQEAFNLLVERQRKYGPDNIRKLGLWGVFGRFADDKVERIRRSFNGTIDHGTLNITLDGDFGDETLEDAMVDSGNYPLIMLALYRGLWGAPLEEDMD